MNTIIVPTDFSATSKNAAIYAFEIGKQMGFGRIIFLNAFQSAPILTEATVPVMPAMDIEVLEDISKNGMKQFLSSLEPYKKEGMAIESKNTFGVAEDCIQELIEETNGDLIVMGISGVNKLEEILIGSTATAVMKHSKVPVIIVPADAKFAVMENIMLLTDLSEVAETLPYKTIREILSATGCKLHVVNVYHGTDDISSEKNYQKEMINAFLKEQQPEFHFINSGDFVKAVNEFVDQNNIQMVITIPKKHGFFESLFSMGHSKKLAFHTHVPLMGVHKEG